MFSKETFKVAAVAVIAVMLVKFVSKKTGILADYV